MGVTPSTLAEKLHSFAREWNRRIKEGFNERGSAQSFLNDLRLLYDVNLPPGKIFEKRPYRVIKPANGDLWGEGKLEFAQGFMDMYIPDVVVWEMKGPTAKLEHHFAQVKKYWEFVQTRYMVLCNFEEIWIFDTAIDAEPTVENRRVITLDDLPAFPDSLAFLRGDEPAVRLRSERITGDIASTIGKFVRDTAEQSGKPEEVRPRVTKFAMECVFAMFAEDSGMIPPHTFTVAMDKAQRISDLSPVYTLFDDFDQADPKDRANDVPYVNGTLFDRNVPKLAADKTMLATFHTAAHDYNWLEVRPEVFGSIFEQAIASHTRHELGAHFTAREDILKVIEPTILRPWREMIAACRDHKEIEVLIERMKRFHILDPACGCGNFLYIAYREMKRLELELRLKHQELYLHRHAKRRSDLIPPPAGQYFSLYQLHGIDVQEWAVTLSKVVLWMAEWLGNQELSLEPNENLLPLKPLDENLVRADALFSEWFPRAEGDQRELAIIGNPPFLGSRKLRRELGDEYVEQLHSAFPDNRTADLVTYWYPKALAVLRPGERGGFVSTNSISQNESRVASLERIEQAGGTIHDAWKSYPWPGEAAVHVSIVNWMMGPHEGAAYLDGRQVSRVTVMLADKPDVSRAQTIRANKGLSYQGVIPGNEEFIVDEETAQKLLAADERSKVVLRKFLIGADINRRPDQSPSRWIIDFGFMGQQEAKQHKAIYAYAQRHIFPVRKAGLDRKEERLRENWWEMVRPRGDMRAAITPLETYLAISQTTPTVAFTRVPKDVLPDHALLIIALDSNYHFGVLQSMVHEHWAWASGSTLEARLRYTNTSVFETFPFPLLPDGKYDPRVMPKTASAKQVAKVAEKLYAKRQATCLDLDLGLTKLYNYIKGKTPLDGLDAKHRKPVEELIALHDQLNAAVCACYGWPEDTWRDENEVLSRLLELNQQLTGK